MHRMRWHLTLAAAGLLVALASGCDKAVTVSGSVYVPLDVQQLFSAEQPGKIELRATKLGKGTALPYLCAASDKSLMIGYQFTAIGCKAEQAVEAAIPPENIICRVPIFIAAAIIAKHTNAVATLPMSIATVLAEDLDLEIIRPPIKLPKIEIFQYWHNRFHQEPANKWIRSVFASLFRTPGSHSRA